MVSKKLFIKKYLNKFLDKLNLLIERSDLFHLFGNIILKSCHQFDYLNKLNNIDTNETFFSHKVFPIYNNFLLFLKNKTESNEKKNNLINLFFMNLCSSSYYPSFDEFNSFIKPVM